ncbi:MAG: histidine triad nucleotide-binding protein [Armatimonadetes bacterium]|nr:histidine triad nucleotide-binding protein [Candidatus Hippobium faecium]
MEECIFCKIANGGMESLIYEDDLVAAFSDLNPQAPIHILVVPKEHISTLNDLTEENCAVVGRMALVASRIAKEKGLSENGYRMVMNCNQDAGQTVFHIHLHLLGGKPLKMGLA